MDWKRELVIAHLVKQKIAEVDVDRLWDNPLPGVAASPAQIQSLENRIGSVIDPQHKEFLLHANGWPSFMQHIDVLGIEDLNGGRRATRAMELIESLEPLEEICGFGKHDLLPIAVSSDDIDLMLIARPHTVTPGKVLWFAGGLIDSYPGFDEWFLAMVDYNRQLYQRLAAKTLTSSAMFRA